MCNFLSNSNHVDFLEEQIKLTQLDPQSLSLVHRARIEEALRNGLILFPQFHTCVITENVVSFPRSELDVACDDPRCPPDSVVTLYFATDAKRQDGPVPAPTPAVPHASAHHDPILHWDSYTNLEISDDGEQSSPCWSVLLFTPSPRVLTTKEFEEVAVD